MVCQTARKGAKTFSLALHFLSRFALNRKTTFYNRQHVLIYLILTVKETLPVLLGVSGLRPPANVQRMCVTLRSYPAAAPPPAETGV